MGDTGIEPVTSSVSGKRATAAPIAQVLHIHRMEVGTGFEPAYTALQAAASPLGHPTMTHRSGVTGCNTGEYSDLRADDGIRTRDIHLGKVVL